MRTVKLRVLLAYNPKLLLKKLQLGQVLELLVLFIEVRCTLFTDFRVNKALMRAIFFGLVLKLLIGIEVLRIRTLLL
jgi:hypothetical protein